MIGCASRMAHETAATLSTQGIRVLDGMRPFDRTELHPEENSKGFYYSTCEFLVTFFPSAVIGL